jgi:hypothetical protein
LKRKLTSFVSLYHIAKSTVRRGDTKTVGLLVTPADGAGLVEYEEEIDERKRGAQVGGGVYGALGVVSFGLTLILSLKVSS